MARLRKRTSTRADDTKVVTFVVETRPQPAKAKSSRKLAGKRVSAVSAEQVKPAAKAAKGPAKSKGGSYTYTALKIAKPSNPYLVGSREKARDIAKRAGILNDAGELTAFFK